MENNQQKTLTNILEIVTFIKENIATKAEVLKLDKQINVLDQRISKNFSHLKKKIVINDTFTKVKIEIITHIDDFVAKHLHVALPE